MSLWPFFDQPSCKFEEEQETMSSLRNQMKEVVIKVNVCGAHYLGNQEVQVYVDHWGWSQKFQR